MNNNEIWKDVPGYEGHYQVSNHGRIKSLSRTIWHPYKSGMTCKTYQSQILRQYMNKWGYLTIVLAIHSVMKTHRVHRLVAMAFIINPDNKLFINHI